MNTEILIIGLIGLVLVSYILWIKFAKHNLKTINNAQTSLSNPLPQQFRQNDKLVVIEDASATEVDQILTKFCRLYNDKNIQAQPRIYQLDERNFAITFPFDIDFEIYCYFINHAHYPIGFDKSFTVMGWATPRSGQSWTAEGMANKKLMLFIAEDDTEFDNVFLTTNDNIGYKLGFAMGKKNNY